MRQLVLACDADNLFEGPEIVVSAGGSAVFDQVAAELGRAFAKPTLRRPTRALLRAGCYITHDHGHYQRLGALANHRLGCASGLEAALEVWAQVQSLPEPGLALLAVGKRDLSFDMGLPVPIASCAHGSRSPQPCPGSWRIRALNDQHAYLQIDIDHPLRVGDKVALGISHPCTTFDKWRWMPVVDEHLTVVDAITTHF
jgi:D-serine dehydratase